MDIEIVVIECDKDYIYMFLNSFLILNFFDIM